MSKRGPLAGKLTRSAAVQRIRARLLRDGYPRLQMLLLVTLTGFVGFAASTVMLVAGVEDMALRYMLAMGVAYIAFLLLLWLWLRTSASDYVDLPSFGNAVDTSCTGGGGTFDGGGASANVDFGSSPDGVGTMVKAPLEAIGGADEDTIPLAVILLVVGIVLSALFVIWSAPVLFAEILVDGVLSAGLYRRLRVIDHQYWMIAALKRTIIPFVLTTLVVGAAGWSMQASAPEARSLGEVLHGRAV